MTHPRNPDPTVHTAAAVLRPATPAGGRHRAPRPRFAWVHHAMLLLGLTALCLLVLAIIGA